MKRPLLVFEDVENAPRRPLFNILGVPWYGTPLAPLHVVLMLVAGWAVALVVSGSGWFWLGIVYGVSLLLANFLHSVGHILGGKRVAAPMTGNLITATRHINLYEDEPPTRPRDVHLSRTLGGPLLNFGAGALFLLLGAIVGWHWVVALGIANVVFGVASLLPVYSFDGEVIFREWKARAAASKEQG